MAVLPSRAGAAQGATLSVKFTPERLGAPTTLSFGFAVAPGGAARNALTGVELSYPATLGISTSGLGLASCSPALLESGGPAACPANSHMGYGSALVEIPIGHELVGETATVALLAGPSPNTSLQLLVSVTGESPVAARIVLSAQLLPGRLDIRVPPVQILPEAPYVALVRLRATLGGRLKYYERVHGRTVAYRPRGIVLPTVCPRNGFRFAAALTFLDGSRSLARATVPCPRRG
ncbi:MAG: hypothetical protein JWO23_1930 [Solirubrobacterales bacterium]|nr:hypothetical protein [Solirubrobacterales bacterium]